MKLPCVPAVVLSVIVLACGNEPFRPETPPPPGISIEYLAPYTAVARQRFSAGVVVFVRDEQSRGRFKVPVQFVPLENSGSVSSPTVLTGQYGKAHVEWTLDQKPGENTLRIIIEDQTRELRVTSAASGVNAPNSLPNMP